MGEHGKILKQEKFPNERGEFEAITLDAEEPRRVLCPLSGAGGTETVGSTAWI